MREGKTMPIEITDFRLSFIWAQTLLNDKRADVAPFSQRFGYANLFDEAQKPSSAGDFCVPWPLAKPYAHRFWVRYLAAGDPGQVKGNIAWSKGVPLRAAKPLFTVTAPWFAPGRITVERYYQPFGAAVAVTFSASRAFTGGQWVDCMIEAERRELDVSVADGAAKPMTLTALAGASLRKTRTDFFGDTPDPVLPAPFAIATVISGSGVDPADAPKEGDEIHRILHGAATRGPNYATAKLGKLTVGETLLDSRTTDAAAGDVVYATKRSRVVWFPSSFSKLASGGKPLTSLSCYHRNQYFAALQAESLCSLTRELTARLASKRNLPQWIIDFEKLPAQMLADMYDGDASKTYRSASLPRQIDDSGVKAGITTLRQRSGLPKWP